MKTIRYITLIFCLNGMCHGGEPMSEERLLRIVASAHDGKELIPPLSIYPKAGKYDVTVSDVSPEGESTGKFAATDKWVDGRYIVSEAQSAGPETKMAMVVEYDDDTETYRKYVLIGGKLGGYLVGTRVGDTRSISWIDITPSRIESGTDELTTESHTDRTTTWRTLFFDGGKILGSQIGSAEEAGD